MTRHQRLAWASGVVLLSVGCTQRWPDNLPARTYTGTAINGPLDAPAAGAEIHAIRPTFQRRGLIPGLVRDEDEIGHATADAKGRFTLRTTKGFATALGVTTSDGHLLGGQAVEQEQSASFRLVADQPAFGPVEYGQWVDPNLPGFKMTGPAVQQIIRYVAQHPHEPMHALEDYAKRGTISPAALVAFTGNAGFFFGPSPRVKYGWGKDVLVFPDAGKPIRLRRGKPGFDPVL